MRVPAIILSASDFPADAAKSCENGVNLYIKNPRNLLEHNCFIPLILKYQGLFVSARGLKNI